MKNYTIINENLTFIDPSCAIGDGAVIYPFCYILNSKIEPNAIIMPYSYIASSIIKSGAKVFCSVIEDSVVDENACVGPYSHLRPNSVIKSNAKIGNFVEVKNSVIGQKTKASHLSYIGDAEVGDNVNIGCGVVFVNYNGKIKQKTKVKSNSFIGSSVNLIAPLTIGKGAFICAGTTVDKDVKDNSFVIGRSKMQEKENRAEKYLKGE